MIHTASYSYLHSKILSQEIGKAITNLPFQQRLDFANNINTRTLTLHHHSLLGLSNDLHQLRASILKDAGLLVNKPIFDFSDSHPSFIIRNAKSFDDPELQLSLGIIASSQFNHPVRIFVLGEISPKIINYLNSLRHIHLKLFLLSKQFGSHAEDLTVQSMNRIIQVYKFLSGFKNTYFVFLTDVAAKVKVTSLLACLLSSRSVLCYHSPISSGNSNANWLCFSNTNSSVDKAIKNEAAESIIRPYGINLSYYITKIHDDHSSALRKRIYKYTSGSPYFFHAANYWKLTLNELLLLDDILDRYNDIKILIAPYPPHYGVGNAIDLANSINQLISLRNRDRLVILPPGLGSHMIQMLIIESIGFLGTLYYPCISSMPLALTNNKPIIAGYSNTIRGSMCYQLASTMKNENLYFPTSHAEYLDFVDKALNY